MAKRPGLTNEKAIAKWSQIEAAEAVPLAKLQAGNASPADLKKIHTALAGYNKLAHSLFVEAVQNIDVMAKQRLADIQAAREERNKPALTEEQAATLLELAIQRGWKTNGAILIDDIRLAVAQLIEGSTNTLGSYLDDHFNELYDTNKRRDDRELREIKEGVAQKLDEHRDIEQENWKDLTAPILHSLDQAHSTLDELLSYYRGDEKPESSAESDADVESTAAGATVKLDAETADAIKDSTGMDAFNDNITKLMKRLDRADKADAKDEADSWWRNFRSYAKSSLIVGGAIGGSKMLLELSKLAAASYITNPELRDWINSKVEFASSLLDPETYKKVVSDIFEWVSKQASSLTNWIIDALDINGKGKLEREQAKQDELKSQWVSRATELQKQIAEESDPERRKLLEKLEKEANDKAAEAAGKSEVAATQAAGGPASQGITGAESGSPMVKTGSELTMSMPGADPFDTTASISTLSQQAGVKAANQAAEDAKPAEFESTIGGAAIGTGRKNRAKGARAQINNADIDASTTDNSTTSTTNSVSVGDSIVTAPPSDAATPASRDSGSSASASPYSISSFGFNSGVTDRLAIANIL